MNSKPLVSIIILNWNGLNDTLECLHSLSKINYPNYQVIIVDNASTDNSVVEINKKYPNIPIISNSTNLGFAEGNNVGIRQCLKSTNEYILLLNNDTVVEPDFLQNLIKGAQDNPDAGIYSGLIYYFSQPDTLWYAGAKWHKYWFNHITDLEYPHDQQPNYTTDYICGCMLLIRKDVITQVGLLEEKFFLTYEESDWCYRAKRKGYDCCIIPTSKIWHKISASFGGLGSPLQVYFMSRNILLWAKRNLPKDEYRELLKTKIQEIIPIFGIQYFTFKQMLWSVHSIYKTIKFRKNDPLKYAKYCGVRDFLLHRFGDCPDYIRLLRVQK